VDVDFAMLCDAATVREGLLHMLGGGINRVVRPTYPAPLGVVLAMRIMVHPTEIDRSHHLTVVLQDADGGRNATLEIDFNVPPEAASTLEPGEEAPVVLPIGFPPHIGLPAPGRHSFEILIDGIHQKSVPFSASQGGPPPALPQPPQGSLHQ